MFGLMSFDDVYIPEQKAQRLWRRVFVLEIVSDKVRACAVVGDDLLMLKRDERRALEWMRMADSNKTLFQRK